MIPSLFFSLILLPGAGGPPPWAVQGESLSQQESVLDSARMELVQGRFWHAARRLRAAFPDGPGGDEELVLLFPRAEAGWSDWPQVLVLLEDPLAMGEVEAPEAWYLLPMALMVAGDSTGAEAAYWSALPSLSSASDQAVAWGRVGVIRLVRGDSVGARGAFHQVLALPSAGSEGLRAAEALLSLGIDSLDVALAGARTLAGAGRHEEALEAYRFYAGLVEGSPPLALRVQSLRRLVRGGEAQRVEDWLVDRFPDRPEAVEVLFSRAEALQDRGNREEAIRGYEETVELAPSDNLAGQARMRMGQILLGMGREGEALGVYSAYLSDFPQGRRWDKAAFWGGDSSFPWTGMKRVGSS